MAASTSEGLQKQLFEYILETLKCIETVKKFCDREPEWSRQRESELKSIKDIKEKKNPEKELGGVLKNSLVGLEELQHFLEGLERLAVTSPFVFMNENFIMQGVDNEAVRSVISTARDISSYLLLFKRDAGAFFLPNLDNVEVLDFQLHRYLQVTKELCRKMKSANISQFISIRENNISSLNILKIHEKYLKKVTDYLSKLNIIRNDESFRLTFLFNGYDQEFIDINSECQSRMFKFLSDLEDTAVQLDRMKLGSSISGVVGSSVGIVGGAMSIAGLILAPFTAGISLGLIVAGLGVGGLSAVNGLVTGITETAVNSTQIQYAQEYLKDFMEDVQKFVDCLERAFSSKRPPLVVDEVSWEHAVTQALSVVNSVGEAVVDGIEAVKSFRSEQGAITAVATNLQEANAVTTITSRAARVAKISKLGVGLNALFIGVDIVFLCIESVNLAHGAKSEAAQSIRSRSALWRSEMEAWDKISKTLCEGQKSFKEYKDVLEKPLKFHEN